MKMNESNDIEQNMHDKDLKVAAATLFNEDNELHNIGPKFDEAIDMNQQNNFSEEDDDSRKMPAAVVETKNNSVVINIKQDFEDVKIDNESYGKTLPSANSGDTSSKMNQPGALMIKTPPRSGDVVDNVVVDFNDSKSDDNEYQRKMNKYKSDDMVPRGQKSKLNKLKKVQKDLPIKSMKKKPEKNKYFQDYEKNDRWGDEISSREKFLAVGFTSLIFVGLIVTLIILITASSPNESLFTSSPSQSNPFSTIGPAPDDNIDPSHQLSAILEDIKSNNLKKQIINAYSELDPPQKDYAKLLKHPLDHLLAQSLSFQTDWLNLYKVCSKECSKPPPTITGEQVHKFELSEDIGFYEGKAGNIEEEPLVRAISWLLYEDVPHLPKSKKWLLSRVALAAFFFSTKGEQWKNKTNWLTPEPICNWEGLNCDYSNSKLTEISLNENNLIGTIPSEISLLTNLENLYLSDNNLNGTIPATALGSIPSISSIYLNDNQLTGTIHKNLRLQSIGTLSSLFVQGNNLKGEWPKEFRSYLSFIGADCSRNSNSSGWLNLSRCKCDQYNSCYKCDANYCRKESSQQSTTRSARLNSKISTRNNKSNVNSRSYEYNDEVIDIDFDDQFFDEDDDDNLKILDKKDATFINNGIDTHEENKNDNLITIMASNLMPRINNGNNDFEFEEKELSNKNRDDTILNSQEFGNNFFKDDLKKNIHDDSRVKNFEDNRKEEYHDDNYKDYISSTIYNSGGDAMISTMRNKYKDTDFIHNRQKIPIEEDYIDDENKDDDDITEIEYLFVDDDDWFGLK